VKNKGGLHLPNYIAEGIAIADISRIAGHARSQFQLIEQRRCCRRLKGKSMDLSSKGEQPFAEPRALKTRVAGDKNAGTGVGTLPIYSSVGLRHNNASRH
jgi:hypothetical protein